jgi:hypothetical protein
LELFFWPILCQSLSGVTNETFRAAGACYALQRDGTTSFLGTPTKDLRWRSGNRPLAGGTMRTAQKLGAQMALLIQVNPITVLWFV